jgi:hypothetical protein
MKKTLFLLVFGSCLSLLHAQDTLFHESCGKMEILSPVKVDAYAGWDNHAPVRFSRTTTLAGFADVRVTSSTTNHVWFPAGKSSDLIISGIPVAGYTNLKLAFDIIPYRLTDATVDKLKLYANKTALILPSTALTSQKVVPVSDILLPVSDSIALAFEYTAESNLNGYRLDNFIITGEKATTLVLNRSALDIKPYLSGNNLFIPGCSDGSIVVLSDLSGSNLQCSFLYNGNIVLKASIPRGMYIVHIGNRYIKVMN